MARTSKASRESIERIVREYAGSGQTRRQFCQQRGIAEHTLHYYQRRVRELEQRESGDLKPLVAAGSGTRLARVEVEDATALKTVQLAKTAIAVVLTNGRRLEFMDWGQREAELARLIRVVEEA